MHRDSQLHRVGGVGSVGIASAFRLRCAPGADGSAEIAVGAVLQVAAAGGPTGALRMRVGVIHGNHRAGLVVVRSVFAVLQGFLTSPVHG